MPLPVHFRLSPLASRLTLAALAGLAIGMSGGCDGESASAEALREANRRLLALAPDSANTPSVEVRARAYSEIAGLVRPVADRGASGGVGEVASANLILAQALSGAAEPDANRAAELERRSLNEASRIRALLAKWLTTSALAEVASEFNPGPELARIDARIAEREAERAAEQERKRGIDAQVAGLRAQTADLTAQAKDLRNQAGSLRAQMASQSATQAEATIRQAAELSRRADGLEVQASGLDAEAARIIPQSDEAGLQVELIENQKSLLGKSKQDVQARAEAARNSAAESRATAAEAAERIRAELTALDELRGGELAKAADAAASGHKAAIDAARKAVSQARGPASLAHGSAAHTLGDIHWNRAHGLTGYASLLGSLASARPALPDAASYKARADEALAQAKAALGEATEAYQQANDAYMAASQGSAELQSRIDRVNVRLAEIVKITSGGQLDIRDPNAAPQDPEPALEPDGEPDTPGAAAADSPQGSIRAMIDLQKTGRHAEALDYIYTATDFERQALASLFSLAPKMEALEAACKEKFGSGLSELGGQQAMMGGIDQFGNLSPDSLDFDIQGDRATAPLPDGQKLAMRLHDGRWKIDLASMGMNSQSLGMVSMMVPAMSKAVDEILADVNAGKFSSAQQVMEALGTKIAAAMGMPGGAGGRGR